MNGLQRAHYFQVKDEEAKRADFLSSLASDFGMGIKHIADTFILTMEVPHEAKLNVPTNLTLYLTNVLRLNVYVRVTLSGYNVKYKEDTYILPLQQRSTKVLSPRVTVLAYDHQFTATIGWKDYSYSVSGINGQLWQMQYSHGTI